MHRKTKKIRKPTQLVCVCHPLLSHLDQMDGKIPHLDYAAPPLVPEEQEAKTQTFRQRTASEAVSNTGATVKDEDGNALENDDDNEDDDDQENEDHDMH